MIVIVLEVSDDRCVDLSGRAGGIVTTTRVTHATPGGAYAYSPDRDWESDTDLPPGDNDCKKYGVKDIAAQLVEDNIDITVVAFSHLYSFFLWHLFVASLFFLFGIKDVMSLFLGDFSPLPIRSVCVMVGLCMFVYFSFPFPKFCGSVLSRPPHPLQRLCQS